MSVSTAVNGDTRTVPAKTDPRIPGGIHGSVTINVTKLRRALEKALSGEVRFDQASKAMYANDASNFRQVPIGVVVPETLDDVVATHRICAEFAAPIVNRGGGTSLSGETVNYAVVIDHSKYLTAIGDTDVANRRVTVQPGAINEQVNVSTGKHNLVFGPDPSSHSRCAVGGNIGNNSCGIHSVQAQLYGPGPRTSDNVHALEVVTYGGDRFWVGVDEESRLDEIIAAGGRKGEIYAQLRDLRERYADEIRRGYPSVETLPRRVSGDNLDELLPEKGFNVARALVGTESTCATALQATLMLTPALLERTLVVVQYDTIADAGEHVVEITDRWRPIGLEAIDHELIDDQQAKDLNVSDIEELPRHDTGQGAWLMVQFGADDEEESARQAGDFVEWLTAEKGYQRDRIVVMKSKQDGGRSEDLWEIRESGLGSTAFPPEGQDHWPGWEDSAVPPARSGEYLRELQALMAKHSTRGPMYGHLGQGCIHSRMSFDLRHPQGIADYRVFMEEAADLVVSFGGSLSGEHGDGQQRAELLVKQYGETLIDAMREFKRIWDPGWKMNPGKVIDPYKLDEHLRLGVDYNPPRSAVKFAYAEDKGDFAHAALRCVGIGKCRVPQAEQTMCPSYQVTREDDAARLSRNVYHFGEFFQHFDITPPALHREAVMWGHCHHRATGGMDPEEQVLARMGVDTKSVQGGCCGLAGSWGFEKGKWQISLDCGEQALLPAVRDADDDTLVVANGFSCKTQIEHATGTKRRALHLAQVMAMARDEGSDGHRGGLPEKPYYGKKPTASLRRRAVRGALPAAGVAVAVAAGSAAIHAGERD